MYIKQVVIQGFKSFKDPTVLEPFDPRHNVIVGRNGSGKSNFFHAIQFVLSDEYARLKSDELQKLLHEGTGPRIMSAYVDIKFDNSDGRLPIEKRDVSIRRSFGSKKDQYFLNTKLISRSDVMNLLESAGFSKSNPYYIVKQGKIMQMASAPDSHRLKLLREIAGTRVYEEKCRESKHLLGETDGKLAKVVELLKIIDERLQILEEEKEELKHFQRWDNERRYLEYTIYDRELKENQKKLNDLKGFRLEMKPELRELDDKLKFTQGAVRSTNKSLKEIRREVSSLKEERDSLSTEQQELLKEKTKLALTYKDLRNEVFGDDENKKKGEEELKTLRTEIASQEEQLERIKPQYEKIKNTEEECARELALKEIRRTELYAKLGRVAEFDSRAARDAWIQKQLTEININISKEEDCQAEKRGELKKNDIKRILLDKKINELTHEMELQTNSINEFHQIYEQMTKQKDHCQATRKEQYRRESVMLSELQETKEQLGKIDHTLRFMVGNSTLNGRDSVKKVIETFREREETASQVNNYYGLLVDNFECSTSVYTAVEVTAGIRLFNHLIETDSFSTKILREMNRQNLPGEATFMPLNRIYVKVIEYPKSNDAIPMISKINYDKKFDKAFRFIFGRTLICRNMEVASMLARSTGLDCVTMEGDQVSSQGSLTGGYFDPSRSRIRTNIARSESIEKINNLGRQLETLREEIHNNDEEVVAHVTQMQKAEIRHSKANDKLTAMKENIQFHKVELATIEKSSALTEQSLAQCVSLLEEMKTAKEGLENELKQELTAQLSQEDQRQVDTLIEDIKRLKKENKEAFAKRISLEAEKNKLENLLNNNLIRRREELVQALQDISIEDRHRKLDSCLAQKRQVKEQLHKVEADLKAQNEKVLAAIQTQKLESSELDKWKLAEKEVYESIEENAKSLLKCAANENVVQQKIEDLVRKISELEALPNHDAFVRLTRLSTKELLKEIERVNKELKVFSHVNKRALEQYMSFSDQKENLNTRKVDLDHDHEKIEELMAVLEQRKYEAIQFTFKQVCKYFTEVFEKLVPSGKAQLVMQTQDGEEEDLVHETTTTVSDRFSGIGIRVSFIGQNAEMREMNQLSGGQKSIVALALIFAIQKCDPAPFYLFDEIDQALDAQHRTAVAAMIHELSKNAQFITTTFRPELLASANKFYGIKFRNKVSHVECITREEAADFVEDDTIQD